jgi:hypothetical protein
MTMALIAWNTDHPLVKSVDMEMVRSLKPRKLEKLTASSLEMISNQRSDPAFCRAMLLLLIETRNVEPWNALVERDATLANTLWDSLHSESPLEFFVQQTISKKLNSKKYVFTRSGAIVQENAGLPAVAADWTANIV